LEDDLERSSAEGAAQQLITITIRLVTPHREISEEALNRLIERYMMRGQLVALEIILEIGGCETLPIDHSRSSLPVENDRMLSMAIVAQFGVKTRIARAFWGPFAWLTTAVRQAA
jgi:hypothetical protein